MNGMELCRAAAYDLRDMGDAPHYQYPLVEKLHYLKRGLRFIAQDLAALRSALVMAQTTLSYASGVNSAALPTDYMNHWAVMISGQEASTGPLDLLAKEDRFRTGSTPQGYWIQGSSLYLAPTPTTATDIVLEYAAWPSLLAEDEAQTEAQAETQLATDLPWRGHFDEALRQFVTISCANRNEYDTKTEQGLYQMLKQTAEDAASADDLMALDRQGPGGLWTGEDQ